MLKSGISAVDQALVQVHKDLDALKNSALGKGMLLEGLSLTTSAKPFPHKLGRKLRGYIVVGSTVATEFADENAGKSDLDKFVYLKSGATTTCNVWVF